VKERILFRPAGPFVGRCLHSGAHARATILPAPPASGICFHRLDLGPEEGLVPATLETARLASRRMVLERRGARIATPEHLLAALQGLRIFDAVVELEGGELPILDGSAAPYVAELLDASQPRESPPGRRLVHVARSFALSRRGAACRLYPASRLEVACLVDFPHPRLGRRLVRYSEDDPPERFAERLARARTFGFLEESGALRRVGLARGATLGNVLIFDPRRVINPSGTRYLDEPARHKLLDALGALSLLGGPLRGGLRLEKASHALLVEALARAVALGVLETDHHQGKGPT
jgi:UDP-3-O-[3-hydroxymyristoyl] N-acetylglucosamine deacetylase